MATCRFLGRSCIEIKGLSDHIIIDPNYTKEPLKGIKSIFITHEHKDHFNIEKINEIREIYATSNEELKIYGPKSIKNEFDLDIERIKDKKKIKLNNFIIKAYKIDCYKTEECYAYIITRGDINVLHTADSANFSDELRKLKGKIDYCFIACFEEYFSDYLNFIKEINPMITFPYHFDPGEEQMAKKLSEFLNENGIEAEYIDIGTEFEF
jgi:L-ascorbate metabolism protein UlaG (beta-lactamase superfamily)